MDVRCVRCGAEVAIESADVVGTGYRCAPCSTTNAYALYEHLDPEARETTRRTLKRRVRVHAAVLAGLLATPIALAAAGATAVAGTLAFLSILYGVPVATATLGIAVANHRRFAKLPLIPAARLLRAPK
jgi:hypothetical protein